jgi:hypothetical protein
VHPLRRENAQDPVDELCMAIEVEGRALPVDGMARAACAKASSNERRWSW